MRFYLKWVNPVIALLILAICSWIYFGGYFVSFSQEKSAFAKGGVIIDPDKMGFSMYFFAKGLFCSSALFLMGEILKRLLEEKQQT
jgi:hypothetical protein